MIKSVFKRNNISNSLGHNLNNILNNSFDNFDLNYIDYLTIKDLLYFAEINDQDQINYLTIILILMFDSLQNGCTCISFDSENIFKKIRTLYDINPPEKVINNFLKEISYFYKIIDINENQYKPLIYKKYNNKPYLYFQKYFYYEKMLKEKLDYFLEDNEEYNLNKINFINNILNESNLNDKQRMSIILSIIKNFIIISGGPGTGKTSIIYWIIKIFLKLNKVDSNKIKIAAPTGRASQRITESIKAKLNDENDNDIKQIIENIEAETIHRLLKYSYRKNEFSYNEENKLPANLILIDEVSMIDIVLMSKLLSALNKNTKIILIGDKNQIPSVEAGAVLNQLIPENHDEIFSIKMKKIFEHINISEKNVKIRDRIVMLNKSYRSNENILEIAEKINNQDLTVTNNMEELQNDIIYTDYMNIENNCYFLDSYNLKDKQYVQMIEKYSNYNFFLKTELINLLNEISNFELSSNPDSQVTSTLNKVFNIIENRKILCIIKKSQFGSNYLNTYISDFFKNKTSIYNNNFFSGQPIIINQNDYTKNLFNGECGIVLKDSKNYKAVFKKENSYICYSPDFLPDFSTAFSLTVHKSQGSEYNEILIILPDKDDSPLLTKEILYTAVTRAKNKVFILGTKSILEKTIKNKISRESGINLWE